ncbi:MAG: 2-amino-4-hydroxy-6-hydroxymethyldihydropteridine diphosphokinase, partial [candidate division WOR-3 bacterium]
MNYAYLSLGTNLFDKLRNLKYAIYKIGEFSKILEKSSVYETEPFGYEFQNTFLNMVVLIITNLKPIELLNEVKRIENLMGRKKFFKNAPRVIDIDILIFND